MVYDERGNALHAFDYTEEGLQAEIAKLRGLPVVRVTFEPSPFLWPFAA